MSREVTFTAIFGTRAQGQEFRFLRFGLPRAGSFGGAWRASGQHAAGRILRLSHRPRRGSSCPYAPLIYIEPFDGSNRNILGFDPLAVDAEREAIERARDTGAMTISGKLVLAQDHGNPGFVMYVPIYRYGFPATDQALRQQNFIGWVDAPYRIADLMSQA